MNNVDFSIFIFVIKALIPKTIKIFKILLPTTFPMVIPEFPFGSALLLSDLSWLYLKTPENYEKWIWPVGTAGFWRWSILLCGYSRVCVPGEWKPLSESGIHAGTDHSVFDLGISNVPFLDLDGVWHQKEIRQCLSSMKQLSKPCSNSV